MVYGRYYSRRLQKVMLEADDYVLILATFFTFTLCAVGITCMFALVYFVGKGVADSFRETSAEKKFVQSAAGLNTLAKHGTALRSAVEDFAMAALISEQMFLAWMALYGASVALSKVAILLLYVRVFTTSLRRFAVAVWIIGLIVGATGMATVFGSIFQCTPIAYNWDKTLQGRCINKMDLARYTAIPNVITGFAMLILPLPMVWRLKINISQKIALTATFLHGIMLVS
ncbi:MAG: hypothetical protein Q9166_006229 [cf. Caloplaca sp. 2 TL-2023]